MTTTRPDPNQGPRHVLVTGGAGFIGSHLVEHLVGRGDRVTIVDNLSTGRRENLDGVASRVRMIDADVSAALAELRQEDPFDEIYHLAAAVGVDLVLQDPTGAIETNVQQTADLLRFAAGDDPRAATPTLVASSSEVYGKPSKEVFSEEDDVLYGPTTVTRWSYACTKALDEHLALAYARRGAPYVVARFFNTVGPRQVGDYGMVLPRFVRAALQGQPISVFGDGSQSRCFCDVRDVVGVLPSLLGLPHCHGRVFNVGADQPISIRDLAELVVNVIGSPSQIRFVPYDDAYPSGFEDLKKRRPDLTRLREATGFETRFTLERTITDLADQIRSEAAANAGGEATA